MLPLIVIGGLFAVLAAVALLSLTADEFAPVNIYGLTVVRVLAEIGMVLTIGSLLFATFMVAPQRSGVLDVGGYAALRTACWAATLWCLASLAALVYTEADALDKPVSEVLNPDTLITLLGLIEQAKAWLITALVALVVAVGTRFVLSWRSTAVLFGVAVFGVTPVAVTGHSSSGGQHDLATNSLLFHLVAASLWVGGLVALLIFGRRVTSGPALRLAATRFSATALVCWIIMAVSGVLNAWVRLPVSDLFTTEYGLLVVAKIAALVVLGAFGFVHRQKTIATIEAGGSSHPLVRLAAVEVLVMCLTIGIAAALARTPPPALDYQPDRVELVLGFPLDGPPTFWTLLTDWRFDLIFGTAAIVLAVLYVLGVRRLRARGDAWPVGRTVAWLLGCLVLLIATSSGFGRYSPAMFSVHMETHMMLSMLAPVLLVLGGPVTLALRALPVAGKDGAPGPREWLLAAVRSPVSKLLTHPVVALVLFVGSFYVLYFSGLFEVAVEKHWAHLLMNLHFLVVGYLFYWPVIGIDPSPRRLPHVARLGMVFASLPFHAFFGVILMGMQTVIAEPFYRSLNLPWAADLLGDQRLGGGIAWATGEVPLLIVLGALLVQWARLDDREARRSDRRADDDGDADRTAYNAMLRKLARGERTAEPADGGDEPDQEQAGTRGERT
ncbi:bifunctional copper resistance protein CopD/cytochrome c oxidase assembly protein [Actinophytocola sp. S1-96]|uniref:Bifunctional copper resistance protein CopD/cytochrome c oxidase assembly protein n=1 Tax=Actinophytocola gossypii TaxID=2812003 RepID=A0ABT2JG88_9PSEU|nr:bifunctional copper resistance protein CopD/cytochrome c oxidase assembly protein [Actinophytocola gossypii]